MPIEGGAWPRCRSGERRRATNPALGGPAVCLFTFQPACIVIRSTRGPPSTPRGPCPGSRGPWEQRWRHASCCACRYTLWHCSRAIACRTVSLPPLPPPLPPLPSRPLPRPIPTSPLCPAPCRPGGAHPRGQPDGPAGWQRQRAAASHGAGPSRPLFHGHVGGARFAGRPTVQGARGSAFPLLLPLR